MDTVNTTVELRCIRCGRTPEQIEEYVDLAKSYTGLSPSDACKLEEGTLNAKTGAFACTDCYIELGCPAGPGHDRWHAGDPIR